MAEEEEVSQTVWSNLYKHTHTHTHDSAHFYECEQTSRTKHGLDDHSPGEKKHKQ